MNLRSLSFTTVFSLLLATSSEAAITYSFVDGAAGDQAGHTLSGTITFDSACGTSCTADDVDSFTVSWTGPNPASISGTGPGDVYINNPHGFLDVSPTGISVDYSPSAQEDRVRLTLGDVGVGTQIGWSWAMEPITSDDYVPTLFYSAGGPGATGHAWSDFTFFPGPVSIATVVPEPGSFILAIGGVVGLWMGALRSRRT